MSAVAYGNRAADHDEEDAEDAPCLGGPGKPSPVKNTATTSSPWQALTFVMAFNLLLTLGALGSQATLLLKVSPMVSSVMDLQAKVTGLQSTQSTRSQAHSTERGHHEESLDLILKKMDALKTQMVSAAQIDSLKAQVDSAAQPGPVGHDSPSAPAVEEAEEEKEEEKDAQAPAPATSYVRPGVPSDEFGQVLVYNGKLKTLGHKGQLHSQFGQDWFISSVLGCKREGFFIDIAANDAEFLSNTLMLERDFGWKGLCLEANREYIYGLARRKCQTVIAAIGAPKNTKVPFVLRGALGGIVGNAFDNKNKSGSAKGERVDMYLIEFSEILERLQAPAVIDYMSLDVEGAESIVMQTFPFSKHTIKLMNIERPKNDLQELLEKNGYQKLRDNKNGDQFWIHKSFPELKQVEQQWGTRGQLPASSCMDTMGYERPQVLSR